MEKYGVCTEDDSTKTATDHDTRKCPSCNASVRPFDMTGVLMCPNCGTQPFEGSES